MEENPENLYAVETRSKKILVEYDKIKEELDPGKFTSLEIYAIIGGALSLAAIGSIGGVPGAVAGLAIGAATGDILARRDIKNKYTQLTELPEKE